MSSGKNDLALTVSQLHKSYGSHSVLDGIELSVEVGAIHGLVGLNGSGKTSTLDCMLGLQQFDSGKVELLGYSPERLHDASGRVVAVFDSPCLNPNLSVRQTLNLGTMLCGGQARPAQELEGLLGIEQFSDFKIKDLSLGNKRRASIAQALLGDPDLVLLDEPFNGLDAGGVDDVLALIKDLNKERGTTFLLSSHQLPYLEQVCSHLSILHQGSIVVSDRIDKLLENRLSIAQVHCSEPESAISLLNETDGVSLLANDSTGKLTVELKSMSSAELNKLLVLNQLAVNELSIERANLADLFRQVTEGGAS